MPLWATSAFGLAFSIGVVMCPVAGADASLEAQCRIGKAIEAASTFYLDANGNGVWDGAAGGDRSVVVDAVAGAGTPIVGDWNGDGVDDAGKLVAARFSLDWNGNGVWEGNAGGDRARTFAASFGAGLPMVGDWDGDGRDEIGTDVSRLIPHFLLDLDGNGTWGGSSADANVAFNTGPIGAGLPVPADWTGDRTREVGSYVGTTFVVDLNGNRVWNGNGGGDRSRRFASFAGPGVPLVGDWDGDDRDEFGVYDAVHGRFLLDLDGDGVWSGNAGGDRNVGFAAFAGPGVPLVCDWDGDGDDDLGLVVGTAYYLDLDGDRSWSGGDRLTDFAIGGVGVPLAGRW